MRTLVLLLAMLEERLEPRAIEWLAKSRAEIAEELGEARRFPLLLSLASRRAPRGPLDPSDEERRAAGEALEGWDPERWSALDAVRVVLVLSRADLADPSGLQAMEEAFRFADVGELVALYRSLAHLPMPDRLVWRAGEGARSNMRVVFEATCCDTPYPATYFDAPTWRQAVIKCLFVGAPLWRIWGLDRRLDPELARMALDLADERRSAGRPIPPELWMCLGEHAGARGLAALELELEKGDSRGRAGAVLGLARAGERDRAASLAAAEPDPLVRAAAARALENRADSRAFSLLDPTATETD